MQITVEVEMEMEIKHYSIPSNLLLGFHPKPPKQNEDCSGE
jgi:hypothetical protein